MYNGMSQNYHSRKTPPALKYIIPLIFCLALWAVVFPVNAQGEVYPPNAIGALQFTLMTDPPSDPSTFTIRLANTTMGISIPDFTIQHGQTLTFTDIQAIPYNITIVSPSGWTIRRLFCDNGETNTTNPLVPINVKANVTTVCTYTIRPIPGDLAVSLFHDVNANNVRDVSETGQQGWAVSATGGPTNVTVNGTTNATGNVNFTGLLPGAYNVCETLQSGWLNSTPGSACAIVQVVSSQAVPAVFGNYRNGSITIRKETTPDGNPQVFTFGGDLTVGPLSDGQTTTISALKPGLFNVFETALPNYWALTGVSCSGNSAATQAITNGVGITLRSGETISCQFANTYTPPPMGTITIRKETNPDGLAQPFEFSGDLGLHTLIDGQSFSVPNLLLRDYTVRETLPAFWSLNRIECVGGTTTLLQGEAGVTISLKANDNVVCTFYNDRAQTGSISANKYHDLNANGLNDTEPALSGWQMTLSQNGQTIASGTTNENGRVRFDDLFPGDYTVCETLVGGWQNSDPGNGSLCKTVTLHAAETLRVWFGNYRYGQIIIRKATVPDTLTQSFQFTTSFGETFSLSNGMFHQSAPLRPGTYSVTETDPGSGWQTTSSCDNGNATSAIALVSGSQVTCTFINTDVSASMTLALSPNPSEVVAPGGDVTYAVLIRNTSRSQNITVNTLTDNRFGNLNGQGTCTVPQTIVADASYACAYVGAVSGAIGELFTNVATATGTAANTASLQANDDATVRIVAVPCSGNLRRDLNGTLYDPINNTISGIITNTGAQTCEYQIGIASYKKFDEVIDNQELFAYQNPTVTLGPWESHTLTVALPDCATQLDLFYGPVLPNLSGQRYGSRLIQAVHLGGTNYCKKNILPSGERLIPAPIIIPPIIPGGDSPDQDGGAFRK